MIRLSIFEATIEHHTLPDFEKCPSLGHFNLYLLESQQKLSFKNLISKFRDLFVAMMLMERLQTKIIDI